VNTEVWSLDWSDDLSVGIPEIDREHQQFVALINDLNRAIVDRMELSEIRKKLQAILDHAKTDAAIEEKILRQKNYPQTSDHTQSHQLVDMRMREILGDLNENSTMYQWIDASLQVKRMLIGHLLNEDMKIRDYCH